MHAVVGIAAATRFRRIGVAAALWGERPAWLRVAAGGQDAARVADGEVWRLATSVLVHADGLHLLVNVLALLALGRVLEPLVGTRRWLAWGAGGGIAGSVAAHLAGVQVSDGASGAAFALLGAAIVLGIRWRGILPSPDRRLFGFLCALLAGSLGLSFAVPTIDPYAHLGGLALGGIAGLLPDRPAVRGIERVILALFAGACLYGWTR